MSSLLDFCNETDIEYDHSRLHDYLRAFKKADRSFKSVMGWSGPRIKKYDDMQRQNYYQRVLAEAYDKESIVFEDALIGYFLVLGGYDYENVKPY